MKLLLWITLMSVFSMGAVLPSMSIPREDSRRFLTDGVFDGGKSVRANISGLRFSKHVKAGFERWVFDFSDVTTETVGSIAPQFQVRYLKASKIEQPNGKHLTLEPARIVINFKGVSRNLLTRSHLDKLARKSHLVKEVISYPPIEDGDFAIEMVLKDSFPFYTHQPIRNEGRLVIDIARNY
ncbi:MAG: hypothetical protein ACKOA8_20600 [Deltaproteobacteria bacterium]